jgi:hypothetical protein
LYTPQVSGLPGDYRQDAAVVVDRFGEVGFIKLLRTSALRCAPPNLICD